MTTDEMKAKILTDPDFVALKRFGYSLQTLLAKYPDGVPEKLIAQALLMSEAEVEALYDETVEKLKDHLDIE
jgi:hypothetical protein